MKNFGGKAFLILFPFHELGHHLGKDLDAFHSSPGLWKILRSILENTGLGDFFTSLCKKTGESSLSKFHGRVVKDSLFMGQLEMVLKEYLLQSTFSRHSGKMIITLWDLEENHIFAGTELQMNLHDKAFSSLYY